MKRTAVTASLILAFSSAAIADEQDSEVINPSDLTRVYTQAAVFLDSNADVRMSGMMTGAWSDDIQFAGFAEGTFGNDDAKVDGKHKLGTDYQKGRAQYFQVHALNNSLMPRVGFSTDLIHQNGEAGTAKGSGLKDTTLFSAGVIGLINPAYTFGAKVFPNVAYTTGKVFGQSADGYMLNMFLTKEIGDSGSFIQFSPEYFKAEGDVVSMESSKMSFFVSAPTRSDRTQWLMTRFEYGSADVVLPDGTAIDNDPELRVEIGMKWFF
ncbi:hypothetical protein ACPV5R_04440 [Vibrio astriarenae]